MFMADTNRFINLEVDKLYELIEAETQLKAADGGELVDDIYGNLPGVKWEQLVNRFIPQEV